jgi:hypothetical protein
LDRGDIEFYHLSNDTLAHFEDGIDLDKLPKTFHHAIDFACRLGVRYIWIDSLCILQDSTKDWLYQSAQMDQVYNNSLCNISATAARNSSEGLYVDRDSKQHWIDEVNLNTANVPGRQLEPEKPTDEPKEAPKEKPKEEPKEKSKEKLPLQDSAHQLPNANPTNSKRAKNTKQANGGNGADPPKKYTVLDLDFWETAVGQAPVNRRGWVLQERMIAPRVLHFCHDQIAWECWEMDAIESRQNGVPLLQLKSGSIVPWSRFKGLVPSVDGKALRVARLSRGRRKKGQYVNIDEHMERDTPSIYCFEVWKRIVENYSRLRLTKGTDKLIALAGIAKIMSRRIFNGRDEDYIAGMWRANLESQLLWRVDPALKNKTYHFHSERPSMDEYRAPSFSWAAIDTERGLNYADVTDFDHGDKDELFIKIETVILKYKTEDRFGMLNAGGFLELKARHLKKVIIVDSMDTSSQRPGYTRYHWQLIQGGQVLGELQKLIYLDAPFSDGKHIIGLNHRGIYCLPVGRERVPKLKALLCLLLQAVGGVPNTFKRIGFTKIPSYYSEFQDKILRVTNEDGFMDCFWDAPASRYTIRII